MRMLEKKNSHCLKNKTDTIFDCLPREGHQRREQLLQPSQILKKQKNPQKILKIPPKRRQPAERAALPALPERGTNSQK